MNKLTIGIGARPDPLVALSFHCGDKSRKEIVHECFDSVPVDNEHPLLEISWPCGGHAIYHTAGDVPLVDVPCQCGNPDHWLIKWA